MTSIEELLDEAAGHDPGTTDAELAADLRRGRQALRRRRSAGVAVAAVATAVVVGGVWTVLPGGGPSGTAPVPDVAGTTTVSVPPATPAGPLATPRPIRTNKPHQTRSYPGDAPVRPPRPGPPVALEKTVTVQQGVGLGCTLHPAGWQVAGWIGPTGVNQGVVSYTDPRPKNPGRYDRVSTRRSVLAARTRLLDGRLVPDKYSQPWEDMPHLILGDKEAVVGGDDEPRRNGIGVVQTWVSRTKLVQLSNGATGLGWDRPTLFRFAAGCR